jgi:hypothetical protein
MKTKRGTSVKDKIVLGIGIGGSIIALIWFIITLVDVVNF